MKGIDIIYSTSFFSLRKLKHSFDKASPKQAEKLLIMRWQKLAQNMR